jgi:hypothetical protein
VQAEHDHVDAGTRIGGDEVGRFVVRGASLGRPAPAGLDVGALAIEEGESFEDGGVALLVKIAAALKQVLEEHRVAQACRVRVAAEALGCEVAEQVVQAEAGGVVGAGGGGEEEGAVEERVEAVAGGVLVGLPDMGCGGDREIGGEDGEAGEGRVVLGQRLDARAEAGERVGEAILPVFPQAGEKPRRPLGALRLDGAGDGEKGHGQVAAKPRELGERGVVERTILADLLA